MSVFRLYNENGSIAFDNSTSVFGLIKSGRLMRPEPTDTPSQKRMVWGKITNEPNAVSAYLREYRLYYQNNPNTKKDFYDVYLKNISYRDNQGVQRTGDLRPLRQGLSVYRDNDFYQYEKSYYIDVVCESTPLAFLHCEMTKPKYGGILYQLDYDESPFLGLTHLYTKKLSDNLYRLAYVSAMPLSDEELNRFRVYIFGLTKHKSNTVGLNLYDDKGNLTFSSANTPLKIFTKPLTLSKDVNDKRVFVNKDGWQDNPLGDYTYQALEANRRYATMGGGITELVNAVSHNQKNVVADITTRNAMFNKLHYGNDWDWFSSMQFGVTGFMGGITSYIGSGYYQYARLDRRTTAKHFEFGWRNANKEYVDISVADVTHLPFPYN